MEQASTSPGGLGISAGGLAGERSPGRRLRLPSYYNPPLWITIAFLVWVWGRYIQIGVRGGGILGAVRFEFVLGGILVLLCLFVMMSAPLEVKRSKHVVLGIALLFFAMIVQIPFAALPALAQDIFVERVVKFAFLALFMSVLIRSPRALKWFLVVWMISIFWITIESVRGLISGALYWQNQGVMRLSGAVPIYAHPNSLGGVSMGAIPFIVFLWSVWSKWWHRLLLLSLFASSITCVIYSGSRTAYVALIAFLLFWFIRSNRKKRFVLTALIVTPLILSVLPDQYIERFKSIGGEEAEGQSKEARMEILRDAWAVFVANPGGVGLGCFPVVRLQMFGRKQDTHNLYYEVATNTGIQGFIVFLFFIYAMMCSFFDSHRVLAQNLRGLVRRARHARKLDTIVVKREIQDLQFLMAVANAGAGFVFVRLVLGFFGMDLYEVYWWFGAGLAICIVEMLDRVERRVARVTTSIDVARTK